MTLPPFIRNVYQDLRDRRLLPVVAVLVVAIPALPLLLGSGSEPVAPPPATSESELADEEIPTLPAVLASDPGLRDYRDRLDSLDSKDPFAGEDYVDPKTAESTVSTVEAAEESAQSATSASESASAGSFEVDSATASASGATGSASAGATSTDTTSSSGSSTSQGSGGGGGGGTTESRWFTYRIDVTTGRAGDAEERKNVKRGTVLPSQSNPVALFLGVGEEGNRAQFLVSEDVVRTHGEGTCVPSPSDCQILALKRGHERTFDFAPNGEPDTYVIKLDAIRLVEVEEPEGGSDSDRQAQSATAGLRNFLGL